MKILMIVHYTPTVPRFRGALIQEMIKNNHEVIVAAPEEGYEEEIKALGAEFRQLQFNRVGTNPVQDIGLMFRIYKLIKEIKPDQMFLCTVKPVIYGSIAAKLAGIKNIYSMLTGLGHPFMAETLKGKIVSSIVKMLYSIALKFNEKIIFQNPDDAKEFIDKKLTSSKKCEVVSGSGINLEEFKFSKVREKPIFLMIARIIEEKGVKEYINAARAIKKQYPNAKIQLLGQYDLNPTALKEEDLKPYIEDESIEYLGTTKDVRPYIEQSTIYVLPSYREGTPRSVLEAMAMGRPILTTDAPGCKETVKEGINGFMVPIKDTQALVDKMIWFIENINQVQEMGQASYQYCKERYDVNKVNKDMLNIMKLN